MFKATEGERKIRELNLLIDMQINLTQCRNSDHYFSLFLQRLSWDSLGTKNVSSTHAQKFLEGKQTMAAEKIRQKSHRVYLLKIIQTSSLGRLQKKSLEHMSVFRIATKVRKPPTDNIRSPQNYFQTNKRLFQCF